MIPSETLSFRLASAPKDYTMCHNLMHKTGMSHQKELGDPTVMLFDKEAFIGFVSTAPLGQAKCVICHKVCVDNELPRMKQAIMVIRLIELYEAILRQAGVKWYNASIDTSNEHFNNLVKKAFNIEPYNVSDGVSWYRREVA